MSVTVLQNWASVPAMPASGEIGFNTTINQAQLYDNVTWRSFVRQSGDTMTGPLSIGTSGSPLLNQQTLGGYLNINADLGGQSIAQFRTTINPKSNGDGPATDSDALFSGLTINALLPSSGSYGQYSAIVGQMDRYLPPQGSTQPTTSQPMAMAWTYYGACTDHTNMRSSLSGKQDFFEADMYANAEDDTTSRAGYVLNFGAATSVSAGGKPAGMSWAFFTDTVDGDSIIYSPFYCAATFASAAFDCRGSTGFSTTVATTAAQGATTVSVTAIKGFYCAGSVNAPPSTSNPIKNVLIGANRYAVTGFAATGAGYEGGTITITPGLLNGTDGANGSAISRIPNALWMNTGQEISFDAQSNIRLGYDGAALAGVGALHLYTASLVVDNEIQCGSLSSIGVISSVSATFSGALSAGTMSASGNISTPGQMLPANGVSAGGTSSFANVVVNGQLSGGDGLNLTSGYLQPPSFTFAGLPGASGAPANTVVRCSNGRKPGEGSGAGSGILVCRSGGPTNVQWLRVGDYTQAAS